MATQIVEALDAEIASIEAELAKDHRFVRLVQLRNTRALYPDASPANQGSDLFAPRPNASAPTLEQPKKRVRSGSPEKLAILNAAKAFLSGRQHPTPTIDIYDGIKDQVDIPGKVPRNNLSAMLSNSSDFRSHGRSGWTVVESQEAPSASVATSAPEASVSSAGSPPAESQVRPVDPWSGGGT